MKKQNYFFKHLSTLDICVSVKSFNIRENHYLVELVTFNLRLRVTTDFLLLSGHEPKKIGNNWLRLLLNNI